MKRRDFDDTYWCSLNQSDQIEKRPNLLHNFRSRITISLFFLGRLWSSQVNFKNSVFLNSEYELLLRISYDQAKYLLNL